MELLFTLAGLAAVANKFVDFSKYITNKDLNGALTQIYAWVAGIVAVLLFAATNYADQIDFNGKLLSDLNFWSLVVIGLSIASVGSVVKDLTKAKDNSDSAAMPKLLPGISSGNAGGV